SMSPLLLLLFMSTPAFSGPFKPIYDLVGAAVNEGKAQLEFPWPWTPRIPLCYKPADDFIFSEFVQDLFADEAGFRFSQIKFNNTSKDEPGLVFTHLAPKTIAAIEPHLGKMRDLLEKTLDKASWGFFALLFTRNFALIMETSHLAERPVAYDEAVAIAHNDVATAYAKLPAKSREIIDRFFCVRRTPVDRTRYVTQILSWYKYMV
ncbi:hypothetical protein PFISCL1PPCAC_22858, partial [Pristionchus fissidentatus]